MNTDEQRDKWHQLLSALLVEFRCRFPNDKRSDPDILASLMQYLSEDGIVSKNDDGKWVLPELKGELPHHSN